MSTFALGTACAQQAAEGAHMIKITNVLVATDFSAASESALLYGREFARTFGATLHVVHVIENPMMWAGAETMAVDYQRLQAELEAGAQSTLQRMGHGGRSRSTQSRHVCPDGQLAGVQDCGLCQERGGRPHHPGYSWPRADGASAADGQCGREGRADRPVPRVDGAASRARVHPSGCTGDRRRGKAIA